MVRRPTTRGMGRLKQHRAAERDAHRHPAHRHSSDASRPGRRRQQSRCTASGASAKRTRRCASAFIHVDRGQTRATKVSPAAARHNARTSAGSGRGDRAGKVARHGASQGLRIRRRAERWHAPAAVERRARAEGGRRGGDGGEGAPARFGGRRRRPPRHRTAEPRQGPKGLGQQRAP